MSAATDVARNESPSFLSSIEQRRQDAATQTSPSPKQAPDPDVVHREMASKLLAQQAALGHGSLQELLEQNVTLQQQLRLQTAEPDMSPNGAVARELANVVRTQMMSFHASAAAQMNHDSKARQAKKPAKASHGRDEGKAIESAGTAGASV